MIFKSLKHYTTSSKVNNDLLTPDSQADSFTVRWPISPFDTYVINSKSILIFL